MFKYDRAAIMGFLKSAPDVGGVREFEVALDKGEEAWDPTSTKRNIAGPARVQYFSHSDGGINVRVIDPDNTVR